MIAKCQTPDCSWEVVLDQPSDEPLCPQHGGGDWTTQRDRADRRHRDLAAKITALGVGEDPPASPTPRPAGMAGQGRSGATRRFAGDQARLDLLAAVRESLGES